MKGVEKMKFKRFEEMKVWQEARQLTNNLYRLTQLGHFAKDFGLRDQMRRASVSVMSNIAEGYERGTNKEFIHFLNYAKGSVGELRSQLYVALDLEYITQTEFEINYDLSVSISAQLANFIKYLRKTKI